MRGSGGRLPRPRSGGRRWSAGGRRHPRPPRRAPRHPGHSLPSVRSQRAHSRTRRRPTSAPRPAHDSRRAPRSVAAAMRSRCHPRPRPRTSPGRRPPGPGARRATARPSHAGTAPGASRAAARASAATRHPGHPGRRSARRGRWPCRKPSVGCAGMRRWSRQPLVLLGCRRGIVRRQGTRRNR